MYSSHLNIVLNISFFNCDFVIVYFPFECCMSSSSTFPCLIILMFVKEFKLLSSSLINFLQLPGWKGVIKTFLLN